MNIYKSICETIKVHRRANSLTQKDLADKIGRTESSIRKYEKGQVEIPISTLEKIANVLDVEFHIAIGGD